MQLSGPVPMTPLVIPEALRGALDQAVSAGGAEATAWAAANPRGSRERFDADTLASVGPPPSGAAQAADLDAARAAMGMRTPAGNETALYLANRGGWDTWNAAIEEIGRAEGPAQGKRAAALVREAYERNHEVSETAKQQYGRLRPYQVDPAITAVVPKPGANASYPSGHASTAYAAGLVLAALVPERATEFRALADQVAWSRVYGGVHFPTDVVTGAREGARIAADVLRRAGIGTTHAAAAAA